MALVTTYICKHCKQEVFELVLPSRICARCRIAIDEADTNAHIAKLAAMPIEERVKRIELELYRLNANERLKALEVHHIKY